MISGRGSNMLRIARCCASEAWPATVRCVISNEPDAPGLESAKSLGLPTRVVPHRGFDSREAFDEALGDCIEGYEPDWIVLAGFMRILGPGFVDRFSDRLVNVHPSLLPAFPGLNTHARALQEGVKVHGATVHFVTAELDAGPIIAQAVVPVLASDDATALRARVQQAEHQLYPAAVSGLVRGKVTLDGVVTRWDEAGTPAALGLAATQHSGDFDV